MIEKLLVALGVVLSRGPRFVRRVLAGVLAVLAGSILRIRRREVEARIRASAIAHPRAVATAMYRELGAGLVELLALADRAFSTRDRVVLTERAERALTELAASGGVALVAHLGNWDLVACAIAERAPLAIVTKRLSSRGVDAAWQRIRAARGVQLLFAEGALTSAPAAIRAGAVVALLVDQAPERTRGTIVHPFLGRPARFDVVPALIAQRARRPAAVVVQHRLPDGRQLVDVTTMHRPPPGRDRHWAEATTRAAADDLARFIREHPSTWLWLHRRWKDAPPSDDISTSTATPRLP